MSARSPKPDSSVAGRASTRSRPSGMLATSALARLCPATWAVPCPITWTRPMLPSRRPCAHGGGEHVVVEGHLHPAVALHELAAQRLAEAGGRLGDLLQEEVRVRATIDVAGGDLRLLQVGRRRPAARCRRRPAGRCRRAGRPGCRRARRSGRGWRSGSPGWRACRRRAGGRCGSAPRGRTARRRRRSSHRPARRRAPDRCPAARAAGGRGRSRRWRRWRPSPRSSPRCRGTRSVRSAPSASRCDTSVGITLASVVISAARRSPSAAFRSAKLSTSPLRAAVT